MTFCPFLIYGKYKQSLQRLQISDRLKVTLFFFNKRLILCIFGQNISIEGSIRGEENIVIEGSMKGDIELEKHDFIVGSTGRFEGDLRAQNVNISGLVMVKGYNKR